MESQEPFPVTLIFSLPKNESIVAMGMEQSLNRINFVRRTEHRMKFEIQLLGYIDIFEDIESVTKLSQDLITKISKLQINDGEKKEMK
jgi:hypothetical protein